MAGGVVLGSGEEVGHVVEGGKARAHCTPCLSSLLSSLLLITTGAAAAEQEVRGAQLPAEDVCVYSGPFAVVQDGM